MFTGNTSNVSDWIQAGKYGAKGAVDNFQVARDNSPKYGELGELNVKLRGKEREDATIANAKTAMAGLQALEKVVDTKDAAKEGKKMLNFQLDAQRKAGYVAAVGSVAMGAFDGMERAQMKQSQALRDAQDEARWAKRTELMMSGFNRPGFKSSVGEFKPSEPPPMTEIPESSSGSNSSGGSSGGSSGSSGGSSGGGSNTSLSSAYTPNSDGSDFTPANVYTYLTKDKGLSHNKAYGLMGNIERESSFRVNPQGGDQGNSFGAFQWNNQYGRSDIMKKNVPNWQTNWKGQIDHVLSNNQLPEYNKFMQQWLNTKFDTPEAASASFLRNWERPAHVEDDIRKNNDFISRYNFGPQ